MEIIMPASFEKRLERQFDIVDVKGDGNCLPRSLARGMNALGRDVNHKQVRQLIAKQFQNDPEWAAFRYEGSRAHLAGRDGEQLGEEHLAAFVKATQIGVRVYDANHIEPIIYGPQFQQKINVYHAAAVKQVGLGQDGGHYQYLQPKFKKRKYELALGQDEARPSGAHSRMNHALAKWQRGRTYLVINSKVKNRLKAYLIHKETISPGCLRRGGKLNVKLIERGYQKALQSQTAPPYNAFGQHTSHPGDRAAGVQRKPSVWQRIKNFLSSKKSPSR